MAAIHHPAPEAAPAPKPWQVLLMIPAALLLVGAFIGLSSALGSAEFYTGFFFLLYWAVVEGGNMEALPSSAIGAFVGVGLGLALQQLTAHLGATQGGLAFLVLILPVLYLHMAKAFPLAVNTSTMLLLTAATISHVQAHASFKGMFINLALAVALFGPLLWAVQKVKATLEARSAARAAAE